MTSTRGVSPSERLKKWRGSAVTKVRIVSLPPLMACRVCQAADGTELTLQTALKEQPLPHPGCTNGGEEFCCCSYVPLFDEEPG